jgi:hypothetical protein
MRLQKLSLQLGLHACARVCSRSPWYTPNEVASGSQQRLGYSTHGGIALNCISVHTRVHGYLIALMVNIIQTTLQVGTESDLATAQGAHGIKMHFKRTHTCWVFWSLSWLTPYERRCKWVQKRLGYGIQCAQGHSRM